MKNKLEEALKLLEQGIVPSGIRLENSKIRDYQNDLEKLLIMKEQLLRVISNPEFKTYKVKVAKETEIDLVVRLCPVCSRLHTEFHSSIADDDWDWE